MLVLVLKSFVLPDAFAILLEYDCTVRISETAWLLLPCDQQTPVNICSLVLSKGKPLC